MRLQLGVAISQDPTCKGDPAAPLLTAGWQFGKLS
jgi:hypothetical protein